MNDSKSPLAKNVERRRFEARCVRVAGFTLIEMLTVLTIVGILAMTAAPSFSPLIATKRAEAVATDLYISLVTARSEATKRNADATLAQKTGGWQLGWQVSVVNPSDAAATLIIDDHPATNGLIVSEAVTMGLGPYLGREYAHDLVYDICREAIRQKRPLLDLLAENKEITRHLSLAELTRLCDPANYLGQSGVMVDRVLESVRAKQSPVDRRPGQADAMRNVQGAILPNVRSAG